jgi:hypothetical protein
MPPPNPVDVEPVIISAFRAWRARGHALMEAVYIPRHISRLDFPTADILRILEPDTVYVARCAGPHLCHDQRRVYCESSICQHATLNCTGSLDRLFHCAQKFRG